MSVYTDQEESDSKRDPILFLLLFSENGRQKNKKEGLT